MGCRVGQVVSALSLDTEGEANLRRLPIGAAAERANKFSVTGMMEVELGDAARECSGVKGWGEEWC